MDLPGIDQPPSEGAGLSAQEAFVPESAPGTPLPEDRAVTDEAPAAAPAPTSGDGEPPAAIVAEESATARQKRFDRLTAENYRLKREADVAQETARQALAALNGRQAAVQQPPAIEQHQQPQFAKPDPSRFATQNEYVEALAEWKSGQTVATVLGQVAQFNAQQAEQQSRARQTAMVVQTIQGLQTGLHTEMRKGADMFPDFVEVVSDSHGNVPLNVQAAMSRSGNVPGVAYYIAKHPEVVSQLAELPLDQLGVQMARIASAMKPSTPSVSNAPPPGKPAGVRGRATSVAYRDDFTPEQHIEWERSTGLRK